jgi:hypothetical protein
MNGMNKPVRYEVELRHIRSERAMQIRVRDRQERIEQYARAMAQGAAFPPVSLAELNGTLWIVDGYHRIAAARRAGRKTILADVSKVKDEKEVWRRVAKANQQHGIPLTRKEVRFAIQAFIRGDGHIKWDRDGEVAYLSTRQIAAELSHAVSHETVRHVIRTEFPEVHAAMCEARGKKPAQPKDWIEDRDVLILNTEEAVVGEAVDLAEKVREGLVHVHRDVLLARIAAEIQSAAVAVQRKRPVWAVLPG